MFYWDGGLRLARADLAIDFTHRQPRAFISHAHGDHMARHEYALCTPATAALYQLRLGPRLTWDLPYRQPRNWGGLRLTTYPAGHCLGSAMLLAEDGEHSLLYTGDFQLEPSRTAEPAELPRAETLIIESTFGQPQYRRPPREQVVGEFLSAVREALAAGATPVIDAYALGKAQEVTRLLTDAGIPVLQHREIWAISQVYEAFGVSLGPHRLWSGPAEPGWAVVVPPRWRHLFGERAVRFAVTGWAQDATAVRRLGVDQAFPLSAHADFDELLEAVRRVAPQTIYCTHGPEVFVAHLRAAGYDAYPLGPIGRR